MCLQRWRTKLDPKLKTMMWGDHSSVSVEMPSDSVFLWLQLLPNLLQEMVSGRRSNSSGGYRCPEDKELHTLGGRWVQKQLKAQLPNDKSYSQNSNQYPCRTLSFETTLLNSGAELSKNRHSESPKERVAEFCVVSFWNLVWLRTLTLFLWTEQSRTRWKGELWTSVCVDTTNCAVAAEVANSPLRRMWWV